MEAQKTPYSADYVQFTPPPPYRDECVKEDLLSLWQVFVVMKRYSIEAYKHAVYQRVLSGGLWGKTSVTEQIYY